MAGWFITVLLYVGATVIALTGLSSSALFIYSGWRAVRGPSKERESAFRVFKLLVGVISVGVVPFVAWLAARFGRSP